MREILLFVAVMLIATGAANAADAPATRPASAAIDNLMFLDPLLPTVPQVTDFDPRDKTLWLAALARPEADMRRQAADAIGLAAGEGMPDLADAAAKIADALDSDTRPAVRHACAQALSRMNARPYAATLLKHDGDDWQTMLIADAAIGTWNDGPAHAMFMARLNDPHASELAVRSALRALGDSSDANPNDAAPIEKIAVDLTRHPALRLEAAALLSHIKSSTTIFSAESLASSRDLTDRLVAATIVDPASASTAPQVLLRLADDPEPLVVAAAAHRLLSYDVKLLAPLDAKLVSSEDFAVRKLGVQVLTAQHSADAVVLLAKMLDDSNREIRENARDALLSLDSDPSLAAAVSDGAVAAVSGKQEGWRGIEQALLLLGATGDHHADARIIELLSDKGPNSGTLRVAAVVAVRRLRIESALAELAERCATIQAKFKQQLADVVTNPKNTMSGSEFLSLSDEGSQVCQALGEMDYHPADAVLRSLIPKDPGFPAPMRAAAIWALGRLHAGTPDNALIGQLMARATDHSMQMPEAPDVQIMAAVAVGRMKAKQAVPQLRKIIDIGEMDPLCIACRWAIGQITGQPPEPPLAEHTQAHGFFLESVH